MQGKENALKDDFRKCEDNFFVYAEDVVGSFASAVDRLAATDFTKEILETILTYAPAGGHVAMEWKKVSEFHKDTSMALHLNSLKTEKKYLKNIKRLGASWYAQK